MSDKVEKEVVRDEIPRPFLDFTPEEASLILAIVQATWKTPLGSREAATCLARIEDKLIRAKVPNHPVVS